MTRKYLGNHMYADWDGDQFRLTQDDGAQEPKVLVLDSRVVVAFIDYVLEHDESLDIVEGEENE
jgi:hypothetical protein